jgi:hypothetical protein
MTPSSIIPVGHVATATNCAVAALAASQDAAAPSAAQWCGAGEQLK